MAGVDPLGLQPRGLGTRHFLTSTLFALRLAQGNQLTQGYGIPLRLLRRGYRRASGSLQQRLAGQIDIKLTRLAQLWPQLRGQINGRLDVAGSLKAPQGKLGLKGQQLAFADQLRRFQLPVSPLLF